MKSSNSGASVLRGEAKACTAEIMTRSGPVIRQLTLPGGKKIRILREDIFQRALHPEKTKVVA